MINRRCKILVLILFSIFVTIQAQQDSTALSGLKGWAKAFNNRDLTQTLSYISPDYGGYFVNQQDQVYSTLHDVYKHIFSNEKLSVQLSYRINDFSVSGDFAVVRLFLITTAKANSQEQVAYEKGMQVWKNENNEWKLFRSISYPTKSGNSKAP